MAACTRRRVDATPGIGIERQLRQVQCGAASKSDGEARRERLHFARRTLGIYRGDQAIENRARPVSLGRQASGGCSRFTQETNGLLVFLVGDQPALSVDTLAVFVGGN